MKYIDQIGNEVYLSDAPKRIVSLVPSQTELLHYLGLENEMVGITRFCIHPKHWLENKTVIGGTKQFYFEKILSLQPDLIIANKEENYKEGIEQLQKHFPVWTSDIYNLSDALQMMQHIGSLTCKQHAAKTLTEKINSSFSTLNGAGNAAPLRVAYFIWRKPYMIAASNTFIHDMLERAGFENCFKHLQRYPEVSLQQLHETKSDVVMLSSEPYAFGEKHFGEFQQACPEAKVMLVDGEMFSWYGSRLLHSADYFQQLNCSLSNFIQHKTP